MSNPLSVSEKLTPQTNGRAVAPPTERPWDDKAAPKWVVPVLITALVVGLAGLSVGAYAVATMPAKTSGPTGVQGQTGPQGQTGAPGAKGDTGAAGPAGTIAATSTFFGPSVVSAPNPQVGTALVARTSCPTGKIVLSGGARVSAPGVIPDRNVDLRSSFPLTASVWQTVAIVTGPMGAGVSMSMKPYVVCGMATPAASSTTPTT